MRIRPLLATMLMIALCSAAHADQPNMQDALANLEAAKTSLVRATGDKGGHRLKALAAIERALAEVKAGIEYDRTHASGARENRH